MHVIAHGGCAGTVRENIYTGSWFWDKNPLPYLELEPAAVLCLAFQSDALSTELSPPLIIRQPKNAHFQGKLPFLKQQTDS